MAERCTGGCKHRVKYASGAVCLILLSLEMKNKDLTLLIF